MTVLFNECLKTPLNSFPFRHHISGRFFIRRISGYWHVLSIIRNVLYGSVPREVLMSEFRSGFTNFVQ